MTTTGKRMNRKTRGSEALARDAIRRRSFDRSIAPPTGLDVGRTEGMRTASVSRKRLPVVSPPNLADAQMRLDAMQPGFTDWIDGTPALPADVVELIGTRTGEAD